MDRFSYRLQIQGGTEQTASSGKCNVVQAGSDTALPVVGSCIDTVNYSRRLRDETGDDKGFVVVADVLDDLVNVVARGGDGGTRFSTDAGDGNQGFEGGKPLAESTPKEKKRRCLKWSGKEREWLYECYLSAYKPGHRTGYIQSTFDLYEVRMGDNGYLDRTKTSIINQLKQILQGKGLTQMKMDEIRMKVKTEQLEWHGETYVDAATWDDSRCSGREVKGDAGQVKTPKQEQEDKEVDFSVDEGGVIKTRAGRRQVRELLDEPILDTTPPVRVQTTGTSRSRPQEEREEGDAENEQAFVLDGQKLDIKPRVVIEEARVDTWKEADGTIRDLSTEEKEVLEMLRKVRDNGKWEEVPNLRAADKRKVTKEVRLVDGVMHNMLWQGMRVGEVNRLLYAGSAVVALRMGLKLGARKRGQAAQKPQWQRRIEASIVRWRRHLSQLEEIRKGKVVGEKVRRELDRLYSLTDRGALAVGTFLKNKIMAGATKIRWFEEKNLMRRQNNLYQNNQRQLFKELGGAACGTGEIPDAAKSKAFWEKLWSEEVDFNRKAAWLGDIRLRMREVKPMEDVVVDIDLVKRGIGRMTNWRAPGPDMVRGFWFKRLTSLHLAITDALKECVERGEVPGWMVKGRTVLIQKDPVKGNVESNYRPIACLPLMWKLLTGIFAEKIYDHLHANSLLPEEQKGCRKRSRGTKDQLLIDREILREARRKKRHLSMAWIDYRKAYDMLPHSWLLESLGLVKVAKSIEQLLAGSMPNWKTVLTAGGQELGEVDIRRGIFQGDSLSPLLFVVAMIPISILLNREKMGYRLGGEGGHGGEGGEGGKKINHLLFMDDLKVYGANWGEVESLCKIVQKFSADIGMVFGLDKCAMLEMQAGVKVASRAIELPDGKAIEEVDAEGYKYLGVLEGAGIMEKEMKDIVRKEYVRRVKKVAESKLYAGNLVGAVNSWAVSVVRYTAGVLEWTEKELQQMDVKTRKRLTMNGAFHKGSNVDRLYMKRKEGGRGLLSVEECVRSEELALCEYVRASAEPMLVEVARNTVECEPKSDFKRRRADERKNGLAEKKLHGKFFRDVKGVASDRSWQWLRGGYLYKSTEGFICAAQENVLNTRNYCASVLKQEVDNKCRMCGEYAETVGHLVSACKQLAQTEYKRRHDTMGKRVYWEVCGNFGLRRSKNWYEEVIDGVRKSDDGDVEVWWDQKVCTPTKFEANRPDLVVIDRKNRKWWLVDFSVPYDPNVARKEKEKLDKYKDLAAEVARMHKVNVEVVPIVVGALGVVSKELIRWLNKLGVGDVVGGLQTSAIIGTAAILRKVLRTP